MIKLSNSLVYEYFMLTTFEKRKQYIQQTRLKNYHASMVLEGINVTTTEQKLTKAQLLKKYQQTTRG
jgi:hypothetical protein